MPCHKGMVLCTCFHLHAAFYHRKPLAVCATRATKDISNCCVSGLHNSTAVISRDLTWLKSFIHIETVATLLKLGNLR